MFRILRTEKELKRIWGKIILLCFCFQISFIYEARPAPITADQAKAAVGKWRIHTGRSFSANISSQVAQADNFTSTDGSTLFYVVQLNPTGFVIVAGDDEVEPIIGFSAGGNFDPSPDNPLYILISRDLAGRLRSVRGGGTARAQALSAANSSTSKWKWLTGQTTASNSAASISDIRVPPLVQSQWNQGNVGSSACYNYYTPNGYPCGCVATAMAQIMRYHQYPTSGIGVHSFSISVNGFLQTAQTRGGNGSGGSYDWSNMALVPTGGMSLVQRQAIGALCYDAGVCVNMDYAPSGSGATTHDAANALKNSFGFANAVYGFNYGNDLGTALPVMVNPSLDAGFPVFLGIDSNTYGGHAIIADGYGYDMGTLYHHLNMGWSGSDDAWYNLPNIGTTYNFNLVDTSIYNIYPSGSGEIVSGRLIDNTTSSPIVGATVTAEISGGATYSGTSSSAGIYALTKLPSSTTYTIRAVKSGYNFTPRTVTTGRSADGGAISGNRWGIDFQAAANHILAFNDNATTTQDTPVSISVLDNDNVSAGWTLTIVSFTQGSHGSVTAGSNNVLIYTPNSGYIGSDSFTYTVSNGTLTETAAVTVQVVAAAKPPAAVDDYVTTSVNTPYVAYVLVNDEIFLQNSLTIVSITSPVHGTAAISSDNQSVLYTPQTDYLGGDNFTYTVGNGTATASATVYVTVTLPSYTLSVMVAGQGQVVPAWGVYTQGTTVSLKATPQAGYKFARWYGTDNDTSTDLVNSITIRSNTTVSVTFDPILYSWTASVIGGHGTISPTGGTAKLNAGISLTATPDSGYQIKQWTGTNQDASTAIYNTATITRDNQQITVEFEAVPGTSSSTPTNIAPILAPAGCGQFGAESVTLALLAPGLGFLTLRRR